MNRVLQFHYNNVLLFLVALGALSSSTPWPVVIIAMAIGEGVNIAGYFKRG